MNRNTYDLEHVKVLRSFSALFSKLGLNLKTVIVEWNRQKFGSWGCSMHMVSLTLNISVIWGSFSALFSYLAVTRKRLIVECHWNGRKLGPQGRILYAHGCFTSIMSISFWAHSFVASPSGLGLGLRGTGLSVLSRGFTACPHARAASSVFFVSGYTLSERRGLPFHAPRVRLLQEF